MLLFFVTKIKRDSKKGREVTGEELTNVWSMSSWMAGVHKKM